MKLPHSLALFSFALLGSLVPAQAGPKVLLKTSQGDITIELNEEKAPESAKNFLAYVKDGFFDKTVFHRVIDNFMIQGGGFELKEGGSIEQKVTKEQIRNEANNGLKNKRGTIAMARTSDPHSASSQFFINLKDNDILDHTAETNQGWGYAVFGEVKSGLDVIDKIAKLPTGVKTLKARSGDSTREAPMEDVPTENVIIESATVVAE